jgi:hypothetical protein
LAFQNSKVRILVLDWQESLNGSLLISVQGLMTAAKEQEAKKFSQTFILAAQQVGYFLMNDIFRYPDEIQKENQLNVKFDSTTPVKPKQQETGKPKEEKPAISTTQQAPPKETQTVEPKQQEKKTKPTKPQETKTQETKKETSVKKETPIVVKKEETPAPVVVKKEEKKEPKSFTYASVVGEVPTKTTLEPSQDEKKKEKPKKQETKPTTNGQEKPSKTQEKSSNGQVKKQSLNQENGEKPEKKNHFLHAVYVSKVPEALTDEDLHKKFKKYGKILDVSNKAKEKVIFFFLNLLAICFCLL